MSELTLLRCGALLGAAGTLLGALATSAALALTGIVVVGAGISICAPVLFAIAGRSVDEPVRGAAMSIVTTIAYLGFLVGPAAVGLLANATALRTSALPRSPVSRWPWRSWRPRGHGCRVRIGWQVVGQIAAEAGGLAEQGARDDPFGAVDFGGEPDRHHVRRRPGYAPLRGLRQRRLGFWLALWVLVMAAEFGALVPLIFQREVRASRAGHLPPRWRLVRGLRSDRLATAPGQPQRHAHDRHRFRFFVSALLSQFTSPVAQTWRSCSGPLGALLRGAGADLPDRWPARSRVDWLLLGDFVWPVDPAGGLAAVLRAGRQPAGCPSRRRDRRCGRQGPALIGRPASVAVAVVVASRWRAASQPRRRALLPSVAGSVALLLFAALLTNDIVTGSRSQTASGWQSARSSRCRWPSSLDYCARGWPAAASPTCSASSDTTRGATLQAALARTLGDPGLAVAYRLPEHRLRRADGHPVPAPGRRRSLRDGVERDGKEIATLVYDASLDDDPELVEAVVRRGAIALENERLNAEAQARLAELQASRERIVAAGDAERRRLERNLHDGAQQRLVALS